MLRVKLSESTVFNIIQYDYVDCRHYRDAFRGYEASRMGIHGFIIATRYRP